MLSTSKVSRRLEDTHTQNMDTHCSFTKEGKKRGGGPRLYEASGIVVCVCVRACARVRAFTCVHARLCVLRSEEAAYFRPARRLVAVTGRNRKSLYGSTRRDGSPVNYICASLSNY